MSREPVTVGGHVRVRPFNTRDTYPEQQLGNDLCQAVIAGDTIYLRGQVAQDLDTRENVAVGDPAGQARRVMDNVERLLGECGAWPGCTRSSQAWPSRRWRGPSGWSR